jgi:hypothetical protein
MILDLMNSISNCHGSGFFPKDQLVDLHIYRIFKMGFGNQQTVFFAFIQFSCKPEDVIAVFFKNLRPFIGLQGNPICS